MKISISPHPHQHLLLCLSVCLLMIGSLAVVRLYLTVVLMCVFQIITDFKHLFIYLLVISMFSLEKCLFKSFAQFYLGYLCFFAIEL